MMEMNYRSRDVTAALIDIHEETIEQLRAKVAELEAKLEKYQKLEPVAWRDKNVLGGYYFAACKNKPSAEAIPLYALEMK